MFRLPTWKPREKVNKKEESTENTEQITTQQQHDLRIKDDDAKSVTSQRSVRTELSDVMHQIESMIDSAKTEKEIGMLEELWSKLDKMEKGEDEEDDEEEREDPFHNEDMWDE